MRARRIYHVMIDRFFPTGETDPTGGFMGGTVKDIIDHIDYIQALGMDGIMLTPFYTTASYHGYHVTDYDHVDPHFGSWEDIAKLVNELHARDMVVVADFVAGHCHDTNRLYADGQHPDWFLHDKSGRQLYYAGIGYLPRFDTDNIEVRRWLTEKAMHLCNLGFDALRLDHASGASYGFWKYFSETVKSRFPNVKLIGEVWGKTDFKPRHPFLYMLHRLCCGAQEARQLEYVGILDGLLDFEYYEHILSAIHSREILTNKESLCKRISKHFNRYPSDFRLWLFLDNHDLNRILFECDGDSSLLAEAVRFTEEWNEPMLIFYGTESNMTNETTIFDGTPYADERVRQCLTKV